MEFAIPIDEVRKLSEASAEKGKCETGSITGIATLKEAKSGDLSFLSLPKYKSELAECEASVVIVPEGIEWEPRDGQLVLFSDKPSLALAKVCEYVSRSMWTKEPAGVHPSAVIHSSVKIDPTAYIGPFCVIESGSEIAAGTCIYARVTLVRDTKIGKRVIVHPGVVLGSDGFGYEQTATGIMKVPQIGSVQIGDDVEIGANTTIDRGRIGPTRIGNG
ncbi:UNVERIFIED_CONTAM: hypothetical protein GTU68_064825, partial [Idotea baltica]|nr:hypothetical protein [Idotea baltica]